MKSKYRPILTRGIENDGAEKTVNFIMLNPSTADETEDDPTIRRCMGYAKAWGCDQLTVTNLFTLRATDPADLRAASDPLGPSADICIETYAKEAVRRNGLVVCAWGVHGAYRNRGQRVLETLAPFNPHALRLTKEGHPAHPLYLPKSLRPFPLRAGSKGQDA